MAAGGAGGGDINNVDGEPHAVPALSPGRVKKATKAQQKKEMRAKLKRAFEENPDSEMGRKYARTLAKDRDRKTYSPPV